MTSYYVLIFSLYLKRTQRLWIRFEGSLDFYDVLKFKRENTKSRVTISPYWDSCNMYHDMSVVPKEETVRVDLSTWLKRMKGPDSEFKPLRDERNKCRVSRTVAQFWQDSGHFSFTYLTEDSTSLQDKNPLNLLKFWRTTYYACLRYRYGNRYFV